ncbi:MAG: TIGR04540 family protein [Clostridiaceae bacterium]|nr:TIGR04540 family protein [Clostridiaceae bacterium]
MRAVYKNPKELATCLKDLVDLYEDGLMSYEKLCEKIIRIVNSNVVYKNGKVEGKIAIVLGEDRIKVIDKIMEESK